MKKKKKKKIYAQVIKINTESCVGVREVRSGCGRRLMGVGLEIGMLVGRWLW